VRRACIVVTLLALATLIAAVTATSPASGPAPVMHDAADLPLAVPAQRVRAAVAVEGELGREGVVELDPETGRTSTVARLDGYLTPPTRDDPESVARRYLLRHRGLYDLEPGEADSLHLVQQYRTHGMTHLVFEQRAGGIPVLGGEVHANVAHDGRLINLLGAPVPDLPAARVPAARMGARAALHASRRFQPLPSVSRRTRTAGAPQHLAPRYRGSRSAHLVLVEAAGKLRLAWRQLATGPDGRAYDVLSDAGTGRVLRTRSLTHASDALVHEHYPGAPIGGTQQTTDISAYVSEPGGPVLFGDYAFVYADVDDDDFVGQGEDIPPSSGDDYHYPYTPFPDVPGGNCPPAPVHCSWDFTDPFSWQVNLDQSAVQAFYFANRYHDHLRAMPIDFSPAKGNFEGEDRVWINTHDGALLDAGLPDTAHQNNAFMHVPPSGPPLMAFFLHQPTPRDAFASVNGADDAHLVYHEYTHGLVERLTADASGVGSLRGAQGDAMNEGFADWYGADFLTKEGFIVDGPASGEVRHGGYRDMGANISRTQPFDCPVGVVHTDCPGTDGAGPGGYTYGDLGNVIGFPESHADGEIWTQTLWDIRRRLIAEHGTALGTEWAEALVTLGMELSPLDPSWLNMRNAILQADTVLAGDHSDLLWSAFAARGMGFFASAIDSTDSKPVEDFSTPPPPSETGRISGLVRTQSGAPVAGALVWIGGLPGGALTSTDAGGRYVLNGLPAGTYPRVAAGADGGFDRAIASNVTVTAGGTAAHDFVLRRNWAALTGGATVDQFDGEDFRPFCGPEQAIDQDLSTVWRTSSPAFAGDPGPSSSLSSCPSPST
jgi:extracellular elastinolytic metalloproteinase